MGNLDLQQTCFPPGKTYGHQLDAFSRRHLWAVGSDYGHGVGHGVSFCGPVHEYPHYAYAKKDGIFLASGMVITNEPGFYKTGHFGIRVENIMAVKKQNDFLAFDCLTLVPYCRQLIMPNLLSSDHKSLIKKYYC
jgi:Xaa-Pro aminopeptidase